MFSAAHPYSQLTGPPVSGAPVSGRVAVTVFAPQSTRYRDRSPRPAEKSRTSEPAAMAGGVKSSRGGYTSGRIRCHERWSSQLNAPRHVYVTPYIRFGVMPVIVVGADTEQGRAVIEGLIEPGREVRAFVTDVDAAAELRQA